jgi:hypothetical protein
MHVEESLPELCLQATRRFDGHDFAAVVSGYFVDVGDARILGIQDSKFQKGGSTLSSLDFDVEYRTVKNLFL